MLAANVTADFYYNSMHTTSTCIEIQSLTGMPCLVMVAKAMIGQLLSKGRV